MPPGKEGDPAFQARALRTITANLHRLGAGAGSSRRQIHLVSYPRSANTLVRRYFSLLQGRPQPSIYRGDVVSEATVPLTSARQHVELVKTHRMPADRGDAIYIVRDGRNATLPLLYMMFLFQGHRLSGLHEVLDSLKLVDAEEGSWGDHVSWALRQAGDRRILFIRYEGLIRDPRGEIVRMARFAGAELPDEVVRDCVVLERASSSYIRNPNNGYLYEPAPDTIYDLLKRHRWEDYWHRIFDGAARRYFHERGGTGPLLYFGYERSADWWQS
jgi:hypothetical protein